MYSTDLTNEQWQLTEPYFCAKSKRGAKSDHSKRAIVNAILYMNKTGAQWRMLPNEFPPWGTVYDHDSQWNRRGVWENVLDELNKLHRKKMKKNSTPSYAIIDAQSVKTVGPSE